MNQIIKMYKFTKYIDTEIKLEEANNPEIVNDNKEIYIPYDKSIEKYSTEKHQTLAQARNLANSCIHNEYLTQLSIVPDGYFLIINPRKGRKFLDSIWQFPIGLINEILEQYSPFVHFVTGVFVTGLIVLFWHLIIKIL